MVKPRRPASPAPEASPDEPAPAFEIPAGMIEEPILTLDLAQRIGIQTARAAVGEAMGRLQETQALLESVFRAVGLSPDLEYEIDEEGHVFPSGPRPNA